jgi:hypothetical protein
MCAALRKDGELAKRRPKDSVLKQYGYGSYNPFTYMQKYSRTERSDGVSALINPDKESENPTWYEESLPTVFMFASVGAKGGISRYAKNYVYDYDGDAPYLAAPTKKLQFYFPITDGGVSSEELSRMIDLIKVVEILTTDSGYQNVLYFTVHNCGPHDVTLLNSLINVKSQTTPLKWTTEILKGGIPKGGNASGLQFSQSTEGIGNIKLGNGGQYYGDIKNQNLFSSEDTASNILWESFNTAYEVYRAGVVSPIDGGWAANASTTQGVKNLGVAFKGMPIRVFKTDLGLEITDYNIGNANASNDYKGDYSHLPVLKPGEQLDLFFGIKANSLHNFGDEVQIVINSDDGTRKKMDCFGNIEFTITMPGFDETAPSEGVAPPAPVPPPSVPDVIPVPELEPEPEPGPEPEPVVPDLPVEVMPEPSPCVTWKRSSRSGTSPFDSTNYNLMRYTDIPSAPFLSGATTVTWSSSHLVDQFGRPDYERNLCLVQLSLVGSSPFFETAYKKWLEECPESEPEPPVVITPPEEEVPVVVEPVVPQKVKKLHACKYDGTKATRKYGVGQWVQSRIKFPGGFKGADSNGCVLLYAPARYR